VQKWKHYLIGSHFIIDTDKSLRFRTEQRVLTEEQFKLTSKFVWFDFEIQYRPGKENKAANTLSRKVLFSAMSILQPNIWEDWKTKVQKDAKLSFWMQGLQVNSKAHIKYKLKRERLYYQGKLVLP